MPDIIENKQGGPRTEEGKQRSSQNSLKHGIFAKRILINGETQEEFDRHYESFLRQYQPEGAEEEELVLQIATVTWRRRRIAVFEARAVEKAFETGDTECNFTKTLGIYEQRLNKSIDTARQTLLDMQKVRKDKNIAAFRYAMAMLNYKRSKNIPWKPSDDGFVFSFQKVDQALKTVSLFHVNNSQGPVVLNEDEVDSLVADLAA